MIKVEIDLSDCSWGNIDNDGVKYRVEGECDTSICKAMCCQVMNWTGKVGEKCEFLGDDLKCMFHKQDIHCKPVSCLIWPTKPIDIEKTNEFAERYGMQERCLLKVVKNGDDNID